MKPSLFQLMEAQKWAVRQRMIARDADNRFFFGNAFNLQPGRRLSIDRSDYSQIQPVRRKSFQLRRRDHLRQSHLNVRILVAKAPQNQRHPLVALGADESDRQMPCLRPTDSACLSG